MSGVKPGGEGGSLGSIALLDRKGTGGSGLLTGLDTQRRRPTTASSPRFVSWPGTALDNTSATSAVSALAGYEQLPIKLVTSNKAGPDSVIVAASVTPAEVVVDGTRHTYNGVRFPDTDGVVAHPSELLHLPYFLTMPDTLAVSDSTHPQDKDPQKDFPRLVTMPDVPYSSSSTLVAPPEELIYGVKIPFTTSAIRPSSGLHVGAVKFPVPDDETDIPMSVRKSMRDSMDVEAALDGHKVHVVRDANGREADLLIPTGLDPTRQQESTQSAESSSTILLTTIIKLTNAKLTEIKKQNPDSLITSTQTRTTLEEVLKNSDGILPTIDPQSLFDDVVAGFEQSHEDREDPIYESFDSITQNVRARRNSNRPPSASEIHSTVVKTILLEMEFRNQAMDQFERIRAQVRGKSPFGYTDVYDDTGGPASDRPIGVDGNPIKDHLVYKLLAHNFRNGSGISGQALWDLTFDEIIPDGTPQVGIGSKGALAQEVVDFRTAAVKKNRTYERNRKRRVTK